MQNLVNFGKKYSRDIIIFILLIICISLVVFKIYDDKNEAQAKSISLLSDMPSPTDNLEENESVYVDIKGAVKKPGVYEVSKNAIINDVVNLAGGFKSSAYKNGINLSKKVSDEMVIFVYTKNEIAKQKKEKTATNETSKTSVNSDICKPKTYDITECIDSKDSVITNNTNSNEDANIDNDPVKEENNTSTSETPDNTDKKLVNINTATLEELMTITGIGESKAKAIISYREENGNFSDISCITNVSGIGDSLFAKIKDSITI